LFARSPTLGGCFDLEKTKGDIDATEWQTQQPDFWADQANAQKVSRRLA